VKNRITAGEAANRPQAPGSAWSNIALDRAHDAQEMVRRAGRFIVGHPGLCVGLAFFVGIAWGWRMKRQ